MSGLAEVTVVRTAEDLWSEGDLREVVMIDVEKRLCGVWVLVEDSQGADIDRCIPRHLPASSAAVPEMNPSTPRLWGIRPQVDRLQTVHPKVNERRLKVNAAGTWPHAINDDVVEQREDARNTAIGEAFELRRSPLDDAERASARPAAPGSPAALLQLLDLPSVLVVGCELLDFDDDLASGRRDQAIRCLPQRRSRLDGIAAVAPEVAILIEKDFGFVRHGSVGAVQWIGAQL